MSDFLKLGLPVALLVFMSVLFLPLALAIAFIGGGSGPSASCDTQVAAPLIETARAQESRGDSPANQGRNSQQTADPDANGPAKKDEGRQDKRGAKKSSPEPSGADDCSGTPVTGECKSTRLAYTTPYGEPELTKVFGPPGESGAGGRQKTVTLLGGSVQVHEKVAPCLESVEKARKAKGINYEQSPAKGGIGGYRATDGQIGNDSYHVYGAAIDINSETNPYCNGGSVVGNPDYCDNPEIPMELVKIFKDHGFYWGGDYNSLKDYMHFEWHGEKA